jgi:hypothetical protein
MNRIINWLLLVIIFVFDPLAIALVIAANFAFVQLRPKKEPLIEDNEGSDIYTKEDLSDWDSTLNDGLEDLPWDEEEEETEDEDLIEEEPSKDWKIVDEENIFDLNNNGKVEKEEIETILNQISDIGKSLPTIDQWRKDQFNSKINKLKQIVNKEKPDDDLTINY